MDIIKIGLNQIGIEEVNSVNSRDIYEYLEVKTEYRIWINRAIEKYDFVENEDFQAVQKRTPSGQTTIDYIVTMDMAKELCMVSNTEKGKETRKYFIQKEKEANQPKILTLEDLVHQSSLLVQNKLKEQEAKLIQVEKKIEDIKDIAYNKVEEATSLVINSMTNEKQPKDGYFSKKVYQNRYGMSEQTIKKLIDSFDPRYCDCTKFVDTVGISEYRAYNRKDMDRAFKEIKNTAEKVTDRYYTSEYINGRFQCDAIDL